MWKEKYYFRIKQVVYLFLYKLFIIVCPVQIHATIEDIEEFFNAEI